MERSAEHQARSSKALLLAQLAVILPLLSTLPIWIIAVWASMAFWYWRIITVGWPFPHSLVKAGLALLTMIGIYLHFRSLFAVEPMVSVLVLAVVLKLLELKTTRDYWLILFLCYFMLACGFLFDQGILAVLLALVQVILLLSAQQSLFREKGQAGPVLRLSSIMLLQALPTMLFLFLVFPRIGPLWSMPLPSQQGRTGMSDSLEFGDIAQLSQSGALAFRASFDDDKKVPVAELYWRGLVLDQFDGRRWERDTWSSWRRLSEPPTIPGGNGPEYLSYTVTMESDTHDWVYILTPGTAQGDGIRYGGSYQWLLRKTVPGRMQYRGRSALNLPRLEGDKDQLARSLKLPGELNPQARALGAQWSEAFENPADRVTAALSYYQQGAYTYTLTPALLGENNVDEFLFSSQEGFCEHFAGSFVFLMRAAGVPARLVVGYQGGEYNTEQNYLLVHQSDAHAWTEVWLDDRGWVRIDPTATVSPDRVNRGANIALRSQRGFLGESPLSLRRFAWATKMRMFVDNLNYAWARWVVNFDTESQYTVLVSLLGKIDMQRILIAMVLCIAVPMAAVALWAIRPDRRGRPSTVNRYYHRACAQLAKRGGVARRQGETPQQYLQRVKTQAPEWFGWLEEVTSLYTALEYGAGAGHSSSEGESLSQLRLLTRQPRRAQ